MPSFCRHNRLIANCPICSRELNVEMRPVLTPSAPSRADAPRVARVPAAARPAPGRPRTSSGRGSAGVRVRRLIRGAEDGYRCELIPGLKSSADAERLAEELAWAYTRILRLGSEPPGLYAEVADPAGEREERTWLAFLIAYLGPLDDDAPFAAISAARTTFHSGEDPSLADVAVGPRGSHRAANGTRTLQAYRKWAQRSGSQDAAITGDAAWTPERRFARAFERLALPGLERGARFDLLTVLGATGAYELRARALGLGGSDPVTLAAKRLLGIGDPMLLERRALELADACTVPLEALDAGLFNWERGERARLGMGQLAPDGDVLDAVRLALGL